jgi:hypothetical protein
MLREQLPYSVPANIVEGFARRPRRSRLHFLNIAENSLAEVGYSSAHPWPVSCAPRKLI